MFLNLKGVALFLKISISLLLSRPLEFKSLYLMLQKANVKKLRKKVAISNMKGRQQPNLSLGLITTRVG